MKPDTRVTRDNVVAIAAIALLVALSTTTIQGYQSRVNPINKNFFGAALKGYDPVAYFEDGKPVKGLDSLRYDWMGAKWYFATVAHRDEFTKKPEKYAPQFGGYCAWAVSHNYTADIDPEAWKIVDGKLYLNYDKDVQKKWSQDIPGYIEKGNENWPNLHK